MKSAIRDPMIPNAPSPRLPNNNASRSSSRGNRALVPLMTSAADITSGGIVNRGDGGGTVTTATPTPSQGGCGRSWTSKGSRTTATYHQPPGEPPSLHSLTNWPSFSPSGKGLDGRPSTVQTEGGVSGSQRRGGGRGKPPLALELDSFVRRELFTLQQSMHREPNIWERLPTFGEVWGTLISHFSEYAELMSSIKKEYDEALKEGTAAVTELHRLRSDARSAKEFYAYMLESEKSKQEAVLLGVQHDLKNARDEIAQLKSNDKKWLDLDHKTHLELATLRQERSDLTDRCRTLADAQRNEALRQGVMVRQGKKLQTDNDRLQNLCKEMETKIKNDQVLLVTQSALPGGGGGGFDHHQGSLRSNKSPSHKAGLNATAGSLLGATARGGDQPNSKRPSSFLEVADRIRAVQKPNSNHQGEGGGGTAPYLNNDDDAVEEALEARGKVKRLMRIVARLNHTVSQQADRINKLCESKSDRPSTPRPIWEGLVKVVPELEGPLDEERSAEYLERACSHIQERFSERRRKMEIKAQTNTIQEWFADENLCESDLLYVGRKTFIGLGTGPHVPIYLRHHGGVRNMQIAKGDVEGFLKKFWDQRKDRSRVEGPDVKPLDDFFLEWLKDEARKPIELAYTMLDVCERFRSDPDCGMFLSILQGRVSEATLVDQLSVVERLQSVLQSNDKSKIGSIPRRTFHELLRKFFPAKGRSDMLKLRFALISFTKEHFDRSKEPRVSKGPYINYQQAFEEDDDGNQTRFIELIRAQHLDEITEYVVDVEETLRDVVHGEKLTIGAAKTAIKVLDPQMPSDELNIICAHGAHVTPEQLDSLGEHHIVNAEVFLKRIRTGVLLKRYSKKPGFEEEDDDEEEEIDELEKRSNMRTGMSMAATKSNNSATTSFRGLGGLGQLLSSGTHEIPGEDAEADGAKSVGNTSEEEAIDFEKMDEQLMSEADENFGMRSNISPPATTLLPAGGTSHQDRDSDLGSAAHLLQPLSISVPLSISGLQSPTATASSAGATTTQ